MMKPPVPTSGVDQEASRSPYHVQALDRTDPLWSSLADLCTILRIGSSYSDEMRFQHLQYKVGQRLHRMGQPFNMLYLVYSGFLKTVSIDELGNEQVLGFQMKGDLIGADGIHSQSYCSETVALSPCEVIAIPFKILLTIGRRVPEFEMEMLSIMSRELVREQHLLVSLGSLGAEARVGHFLASMSERFCDIGLSGKQFTLGMSRQEIANYLGLTTESVSRFLSAFSAAGYITVKQRTITIHDVGSLKAIRRASVRRDAAARKQCSAPV